MGVIEANSIGAPLAEFFRKGETSACIIACYDATLQLQSSDVLWAITTHDHAGAYRIVVPTLPAWVVADVVQVGDGLVSINDVAVQWDSRTLWNPSPVQRELTETERAIATQTIAQWLRAQVWPETQGFWDVLAELWSPFSEALQHRDERMLQACVMQLLGRGTGLTPTGDDLLQALLVTLYAGNERDQQAFEVLSQMIEPTLSRTTPLSQQFLREALQGWAFGSLKNLLEELPAVRHETIRALLNVGASSGMAYGLGVLLALSYSQKPVF